MHWKVDFHSFASDPTVNAPDGTGGQNLGHLEKWFSAYRVMQTINEYSLPETIQKKTTQKQQQQQKKKKKQTSFAELNGNTDPTLTRVKKNTCLVIHDGNRTGFIPRYNFFFKALLTNGVRIKRCCILWWPLYFCSRLSAIFSMLYRILTLNTWTFKTMTEWNETK